MIYIRNIIFILVFFFNQVIFANTNYTYKENSQYFLNILKDNNLSTELRFTDDDLLKILSLIDTKTNNAKQKKEKIPSVNGILPPISVKDYNDLFKLLKRNIKKLNTYKYQNDDKKYNILKSKIILLLIYVTQIEANTFKTLNNYYKTNTLKIEPKSIAIIDFETFCLRSGAPAPSTGVEPMTFEKNNKAWQSKLIQEMKKKKYSKTDIQHMLWNIQRQKPLNSFSKEKQNLIEKVLPSYQLSKTQKTAEKLLSKVGVNNIMEGLSSTLAKTIEFKDKKYNKQENYYKILETPSTSALPKNIDKFSKIEDDVVVRVESTNTYKNASVTFCNQSDTTKTINPSEYIAKTHRKTQPLGFLNPTQKSIYNSAHRMLDIAWMYAELGLVNTKDKDTIKEVLDSKNLDILIDTALMFMPSPVQLANSLAECLGLKKSDSKLLACASAGVEVPLPFVGKIKNIKNAHTIIKKYELAKDFNTLMELAQSDMLPINKVMNTFFNS